MHVISMNLGPVQVNCYVVMDEGHALIIDPGDYFQWQKIQEEYEVTFDAILLTHAHFDHIGGVDRLVDELQIPVFINPSEMDFLNNPHKNGSTAFGMNVAVKKEPQPFIEGVQQIGHFEVETYFCPGHSIGSTVFKIGQCLFTGDVLFKDSIGRTDLYSGSYREMEKSLQKLKQIQGMYHVLPGHGEFSTLDIEKQYNYYLR